MCHQSNSITYILQMQVKTDPNTQCWTSHLYLLSISPTNLADIIITHTDHENELNFIKMLKFCSFYAVSHIIIIIALKAQTFQVGKTSQAFQIHIDIILVIRVIRYQMKLFQISAFGNGRQWIRGRSTYF
jgi:hypothetical protein